MSNEDASPSGEDQSNSTSPQTAMSRSVEREMASEVQPENVTEDHVMIDADDENPVVNGEEQGDSTESDEGPKEITPVSPIRLKNTPQNVYASPTVARGEVPVAEAPMSIKDSKNLAELSELVKSSSPEVLQALLKENWRSFLFETSSGTQTTQNVSHLSFILRAGFKNSPTVVLDKVLNSAAFFRPEAVDIISRKNLIADRVLGDSTSSQLLRQVPEKVLEQAFTEHLKVMPAKQIITMLAKTDRLGYKHDDILDPEDESVMPYMPTPGQEDEDMTDEVPAPYSNHGLALPDTDPLLAEQERNAAALRMMPPVVKAPKPTKLPNQLKGASFQETAAPRPTGPMSCGICHRMLPNYSAYNFHAKKRVCEKTAPTEGWKWQCQVCGLGFSGKAGLVYHENKKVCQSDDIAHATTPSRQLQAEAAESSQALPPMVDFQTRPRDPPVQTYIPPPQPRAQVQIPIQTPHRNSPIGKAQDSEPRVQLSPSELPPDKLAQMNKQLADQDARYHAQQAAVATDPKFPTQEEKRTRLVSLKASDATRRSQIRKSFGVTLRMRDKDKKALSNSKLQNVRPSLEGFRRTSGPGTPAHSSSPLVGNFSPINAQPNGPRNSYQPPNPPKFGVLVPGTSPYSQPPPGSHQSPNLHNSPHFPSSQLPPMYSQPPPSSSSMAPVHYGQFSPQPPQHPNHQHPNKRQRTSGEGTYSPNSGSNISQIHPHQHPNQLPPLQNYPPPQPHPTPYQNAQYTTHPPLHQSTQQQGMSMVEVRSEDAATRISKDKEKRKNSTSWLKPSFESPSGASQTQGGPSQATIKSKIQDAVIALSSSESESEPEARGRGTGGLRLPKGIANEGSGLRVEVSASGGGGMDVDADKPLPSVEV